jgi:hypothetical protein
LRVGKFALNSERKKVLDTSNPIHNAGKPNPNSPFGDLLAESTIPAPRSFTNLQNTIFIPGVKVETKMQN